MSILFTSQFHDKNRPKVYLDLEAHDGSMGRLVIELFPDLVPMAASEFLAHCTGHYGPSYAGCHWERIAPGFIAQASSPNPMLPQELSVMTSSVGEQCDRHIDIERINPLSFDRRGRVGLIYNPETRKLTPQFFITFGDAIYLDGTHYVVGQIDMSIPSCVDTLDQLEEAGLTQDVILSASDKIDVPYTDLMGICRRDIVIRRMGLCDSDLPIIVEPAEYKASSSSSTERSIVSEPVSTSTALPPSSSASSTSTAQPDTTSSGIKDTPAEVSDDG